MDVLGLSTMKKKNTVTKDRSICEECAVKDDKKYCEICPLGDSFQKQMINKEESNETEAL